MSIEVLSEDQIAGVVLKIMDRPMRLLEIREELRKQGILVSYARLRRILKYLVGEGLVTCFKYGKAIMYIKKELLT